MDFFNEGGKNCVCKNTEVHVDQAEFYLSALSLSFLFVFQWQPHGAPLTHPKS